MRIFDSIRKQNGGFCSILRGEMRKRRGNAAFVVAYATASYS